MMFRNVLINPQIKIIQILSIIVAYRLLSVAGFNFVLCISLSMYDYFQNCFSKKKKNLIFLAVSGQQLWTVRL